MEKPLFRQYWLVVSLMFIAVVSAAQPGLTNYQVIRRFGFPDKSLHYPATVFQGSDGWLYGVGALGGVHNGGAIFRVDTNGLGFTLLHSFSDVEGYYTHRGHDLVEGPDGILYGTTPWGGATNGGTLFKLNRDGSGFAVLHSFTRNGEGEWQQTARLIASADGTLYGTTWDGGDHNLGAVFRMNRDGSGFTLLHSFGGTSADGQYPAGLVQATNGLLYGVTSLGGTSADGTVFQIATNGNSYSVLHNFTNMHGAYPSAPVMEGSDGMLYGTTEFGGATDFGTVFKLNKSGGNFQKLHDFALNNNNGRSPFFGLVEATNSVLYGIAFYGGSGGAAYRINRDGTGFGVVHRFEWQDGQSPMWLTRSGDSNLYGAAFHSGIFNGGTLFRVNAGTDDFRVIHNFNPSGGDGDGTQGRILEASDGLLYGAGPNGGAYGGGTVFRLNSDGTGYALLHSFAAPTGNVFRVRAGLLEGADGLLYGTAGSEDPTIGNIFKLPKDGTGFTVLHNFATIEGQFVMAGLIQDSGGVLYGTASSGGSFGRGTLFRLNTNGMAFSVLRHFNGADGSSPQAALIQASDGKLYGTTAFGGTFNRGTIFTLDTNATSFVTLRSFSGADGREPLGALLEGTDGFLYGTTRSGGSASFYGTVFRINKNGSGFVVIHHFSSVSGEGYWPECALEEGSDNGLYGTTRGGGNYLGTIFRVDKDGSDYRVLHRFGDIAKDGGYPSAGLIIGSDQSFYGTAGSVYRLGADSPLKIQTLRQLQPNVWWLGGRGFSGRTYAVQATTNLASTNWSTVGSVTSSIPHGFWSFDEASSTSVRFYRAVSQ